MTNIRKYISVAAILLFTISIVNAMEIKGDIAEGTGTQTWDASAFPGFWKDSEGLGTETLEIIKEINNDTIDPYTLIYSTHKVEKTLRAKENKHTSDKLEQLFDRQGIYYIMGWQGKPYVPIRGKAFKLSELLLEQNDDDSKVLGIGESWQIGNWNLVIDDIVDTQVSLSLMENGSTVDNDTLEKGSIYIYNSTITYTGTNAKDNAPLFLTYIDDITSDNVTLKYTWVVSKDVTEIGDGYKSGALKLRTLSNDEISLANKKNIPMIRNSIINIVGNFKFKVEDTDDLRYYPFIVVAGTPPKMTEKVEIRNIAFIPDNITVVQGTDVTWMQSDVAPHTVTSHDDIFDSGIMNQGQTFNWTFNEVGMFDYHCEIHASMIGKVNVVAPTPEVTPTPEETVTPEPTETPTPEETVPSPTPTPEETVVPEPTETPTPEKSSISGYVVNDVNNDDIKDANDIGLSGMTIKLIGRIRTGDDVKIVRQEVVTDDTGFYTFGDVLPGKYIIIKRTQRGFISGDTSIRTIRLNKGQSIENVFLNRELKPKKPVPVETVVPEPTVTPPDEIPEETVVPEPTVTAPEETPTPDGTDEHGH